MVVKNYINYTIPHLRTTDTVEQTLDLLSEFKLNAMVLVEGGSVISIISEQMLDNLQGDLPLVNIPFLHREELILDENLPFFEALRIVSAVDKDVIAVVDAQFMYQGTVTKADLYQKFVEGLSLNTQGGIIEIKLKDNTYSLSEISRLIEQEHAHIVSMFLFSRDINQKSIIMKLDAPQISFIVHSLERFGYEVLSYFSTEHVGNLEKDRFDLLMKYLNI
jgi:acetoin utilization protein AcuB